MLEERYLAYFPDPFGVGASRYFLKHGSFYTELSASDASALDGPVVTYDAASLIDDLRKCNVAPPAALIDVGEAIRLCSGVSRADGGERRWSFWRRVRPYFQSKEEWLRASEVHEARSKRPEREAEATLLASLLDALELLWAATKTDLEKAGEFKRFFDIEVPAASVFYRRQVIGLPIDNSATAAALSAALQTKYEAYLKVADLLNVSPTGLNYWNISGKLAQTDVRDLEISAEGYNLRDQLRIASAKSVFADVFTSYMDASRDVDVLTRLSDGSGRVYPTFHPFGTITSRVLVSDPYLQELKRKYRNVIVGEEGYRLWYLDYSQFEPGVMASLSGDEHLVKLYNEGDVYTALSASIFGDPSKRDLCKRIFLAFSYGMSTAGIARLLAGPNSSEAERTDFARRVDEFFSKFPRLLEFKAGLERRLADDGYIATLNGNRRIRTHTGPLVAKERRWAVSQVIQGTASLIFKKAIIDLAARFGSTSMLLPMHDAVLMQFPAGEEGPKMVAEAQQMMVSAFLLHCPGLSPRVTIGAFG